MLILLNLLVKPVWIFGIDRNVQNLLGAAEYGLFFSLFNFSLLLNIILDFGLTNFNNREISRHSQLLSKYLSNIVVVKLILAFVYIIFSLCIALIMGYNGRQIYILSILVVNQILASFILYLRSNLSGLHLFKTDSILSVLDRFLMILLCSVMIWGNLRGFNFSIEWFVYAQTFSYLITALFVFSLVVSKTKFFKPSFDRLFILSILKQSYPYAILIFLMTLYSRIDSVLIERFLPNGSTEAGIYAQAFRLLDAASMVPFLFAGLLLPMFSKMIKNKEAVQPLLAFAFSLLIIPAIAFTNSCIFYRVELMDLFYHQHAKESSVILGFLMVSFSFISINYIFGTLLTANGNIKMLNKISALGVLLSITINVILIPVYKASGAAFTNMLIQLIIMAFQVYATRKLFHFNLKYEGIRNFILFFICSLAITYGTRLFIDNWVTGFLISMVSIGLLGLILRLVRVNELIQLFFEDKN